MKKTGILLSFFLSILVSLSSLQAEEKIIPDNPQPFGVWLEELKAEALGNGISAETLRQALANIEPIPRIIELDRKQPEFTQTYEEYISRRVSPTRIAKGREKIGEFSSVLTPVSDNMGVQDRFIAAIWGMETNYGGYTGGYNVIAALATLAYDMRRPDFFRKELLRALEILDQGHIAPEDMKGSWAGAMGQGQFMPSSFFAYAYDFDGDGRKDIWIDEADVFASIANYLKKHGWQADQTWGREVSLPEDVDGLWEKVKQKEKIKSCRRALKDHSKQLTLEEWKALGVKTKFGGDLPDVGDRPFKASLVMPAGKDGPAYLTYENFRSILKYNCSNYYALGVSLLSDELK
ncbi:lytic murein transglycosylase [Emcibacter sp.]|uniref:lytic murein transglycosylase n=1 Tax=Emcibacter sp. TaxID=1979954 RepID=UPI002AA76200|nr:lytic murein transglycosylase [Emcibacter sp.]